MKHDIFPLSVWKTTYNDVLDIKTNVFPKIEQEFDLTKDNNNPTMVNGTLCTYNQYDKIHQMSEAKELVRFAENEAKLYWKELNYTDLLEPKMIQ